MAWNNKYFKLANEAMDLRYMWVETPIEAYDVQLV